MRNGYMLYCVYWLLNACLSDVGRFWVLNTGSAPANVEKDDKQLNEAHRFLKNAFWFLVQ